jgi:putative heme-binding domain-containing protein
VDAARIAVVLQSGKIVSFVDDEQTEAIDVVIDLANPPPKQSEFDAKQKHSINAYSMAFHPNYESNGFVYVCYVVLKPGGLNEGGTHIARFKMRDTQPPTLDYESEETILRFTSGGHNGCTLEFGPDGYLYISIGDIADPTPPDPLKTGQDISDVYASILRIDVDHPSRDSHGNVRAYSIPTDNPFVGLPKARGEVFAFGLRNPWRMSFDHETGDLWVGDVGWEAYEMVYRVRSGGNYGWSIKEGPGDAVPDLPIGPAPISPPDISFGHSEAASITGGFVYRGPQFPELRGKYLFGDWITRRFWSAEFDARRVTRVQEIASGEVKPICFALDRRGELMVLEYIQWNQPGGIYRLEPNPVASDFNEGAFPRRLSDTGAFRDVKTLDPNPGVVAYELNSHMWMDGADATYHLAIPGNLPAQVFQTAQPTFDWFKSKVLFPKGTVLLKTYFRRDGGRHRWIETQMSHYEGPNDWRFYTYAWLEDQSDAVLVPAEGLEKGIAIADSSSSLTVPKTWNFASRNECRVCHTPWSGDALGFMEEQLRNPSDSNDAWRKLQSQGLIAFPKGHLPKPDGEFTAMAAAGHPSASLPVKARSYLHSNCAHCHQFGGNGAAAFDVRFEKSLAETNTMDATPMKGHYGLGDAKLIAPGEPDRSVLYYRIAKSGNGRMPHIGAKAVDRDGVMLLRNWILAQPKSESRRRALDVLTSPLQKATNAERQSATKELLSTTSGAMDLMHSLQLGSVPSPFMAQSLQLANLAADPSRDLLEALLPPEQRQVRLGSNFDKKQVLELNGDSQTGKQLLLNGVGQCILCHRIGDQGKDIGPSLLGIGLKYPDASQLLDHLKDPSLAIAQGYRSSTIVTTDNETVIGRVLKRDQKTCSILLADGTMREVEESEIEVERESQISLMPQGLLASLTPQQVRDILAYLDTLREPAATPLP